MHILSQFCRAASLAAIGATLALTMTALAGPAAAHQDDESHARHYASERMPTAEEIEAMIPSEEELAAMIPSEAELREMIPSEAELRAMMPDSEALVTEVWAEALDGLQEARREIAADADIPGDLRAEVLASLDAHIARMSH
ncbi:hypothetical protein [Parasphingopyxis lamellibrachiae]|uniref:LTXXQ motif family protein n=1 Tax=Parasphingopyxis lamellibrachiae TaxID=680125 RepID=A0A3D9FB68_9SPHN|nr:hypothetical protein [Parasphingopyxis lamellibrachiae]RED15084.1 hypothetical protein DFR46_0069 [Parasphingopyxis lamellibrachiae]